MAKKQTDWGKMVACGRWLETFLAPELFALRLKEIYEKGLKVIGLKYDVPDNHPFFSRLLMLGNENVGLIKLEKIRKLSSEELSNDEEYLYYRELHDIVTAREYCIDLLEGVAGGNTPWGYSFVHLLKSDKEPEVDVRRQLSHYEKMLNKLLFSYSGIGEYLSISDCRITNTKCFLKPVPESPNFSEWDPIFDDISPKIVPVDELYLYGELYWLPIISRIFFDFLLLGGQEYCGFCEYCNKFYIAERKGRKKFCSDSCRTLNQRK